MEQHQRGLSASAVQSMIVQDPSGQALAAAPDVSQQGKQPAQCLAHSAQSRPSTISIFLDILFPIVYHSFYIWGRRKNRRRQWPLHMAKHLCTAQPHGASHYRGRSCMWGSVQHNLAPLSLTHYKFLSQQSRSPAQIPSKLVRS